MTATSPRSWLLAVALLAFAGLYASAPGTAPWAQSVVKSVAVLYENRNSSPDVRGAALQGTPWRLIRKAAAEIPSSSRVLIPDGRRYSPVSNRVWSAYYLYPRKILQAPDLAGRPLEGAVDYVLVYRGSGLDLAGLPPDTTTNGIVPIVATEAGSGGTP